MENVELRMKKGRQAASPPPAGPRDPFSSFSILNSKFHVAAVGLSLAAACGGTPPAERAPAGEGPIVVSAAMSLRQVLVDIGEVYEAEGRGRTAFNFGPANSLARQIIEGAPVDVFVSADEAQMNAAVAAGAMAEETRVDLVSNQLVIIVPADRPERLSSASELAGAAFRRIAVGEPEAVPVGVYAKAYFESIGIWSALAPKIVPVTSVRAALGAVEDGGADAGVVYRTDAALSSRVAVAFEVPVAEGPRIRYVAAVTRASARPDAARAFLAFLAGPEARALFEKSGFVTLTPSRRDEPDAGSRTGI